LTPFLSILTRFLAQKHGFCRLLRFFQKPLFVKKSAKFGKESAKLMFVMQMALYKA
jgi:hypothetical protein